MVSEDTLRDIKTRRSQAEAKRTRAEVELETAQKRRQDAIDALRDEFNVTTTEDIQKVHSELQAGVDDAVAHVLAVLGE
jgi:F0F1-type ATP synthase membrane subunit b/b'